MSHCGNLDNNAESSADDGGLTCEVLERKKKSIKVVDVLFCINNLWFQSVGTKESAVIKKRIAN